MSFYFQFQGALFGGRVVNWPLWSRTFLLLLIHFSRLAWYKATTHLQVSSLFLLNLTGFSSFLSTGGKVMLLCGLAIQEWLVFSPKANSWYYVFWALCCSLFFFFFGSYQYGGCHTKRERQCVYILALTNFPFVWRNDCEHGKGIISHPHLPGQLNASSWMLTVGQRCY